jgi:WD40 repeat protein
VSGEGRVLAAPAVGGQVYQWGPGLTTPEVRLAGPARAARLSADGRTLYTLGVVAEPTAGTGGPGGMPIRAELAVWQADTGQRSATVLGGRPDTPRGLAVHPGGRRMAVGDIRGHVRVYTHEPPAEVMGWAAHDRLISDLAYSPDGRWLATAGWDAAVKVWDAETGGLVALCRGHVRSATGVAFSPDGKRLASGGDDGAVKIWDPATGWEVLTLAGPGGAISGLAYSPDGDRLVAADQNGGVQFWHAGP